MATERTMRVKAMPFDSADEAVRHAGTDQELAAVLLNGAPHVVAREDADRLERSGARFAYLFRRNDCVMTVPVN